MRLRLLAILFLLASAMNAAAATFDIAPHSLGSNNAGSPFIVSASTEFAGLGAYHAFDFLVSANRYWIGTNHGTDWLKVDFGRGETLTSYAIQVNDIPEPNRAPKNWTFQGSNDDASYTTLGTETNQTSWGSGETRTFTVASPASYRYYKVDITANNGDADYTQIGELFFYTTLSADEKAPHNMSAASTPSPYVASASTTNGVYAPWKAFDGKNTQAPSTDQFWQGNNSGVDWLKIDMGASNAWRLSGYAIKSASAGASTQAPKNWTMEGSNDDAAWATLDTIANETNWGAGDYRIYTVALSAVAYRYFRLNVSANNGDATFTEVEELFLQGTSGTRPYVWIIN